VAEELRESAKAFGRLKNIQVGKVLNITYSQIHPLVQVLDFTVVF